MRRQRERLNVITVQRTKDYYRLRYHWLGELCWLRAKRRNGTATRTDIKIVQKELARIRKEEAHP
jgi:hypothetical protein